jgi:hypothetical protein
MRNLTKRLDALETIAPLLVRAELLVARRVPPAQWPDAELEAWAEAYCGDLKHLTDAELDALIAEAEGGSSQPSAGSTAHPVAPPIDTPVRSATMPVRSRTDRSRERGVV